MGDIAENELTTRYKLIMVDNVSRTRRQLIFAPAWIIKKQKLIQTFRQEYTRKYHEIVKSHKGVAYAKCTTCYCGFSISHGGENDVTVDYHFICSLLLSFCILLLSDVDHCWWYNNKPIDSCEVNQIGSNIPTNISLCDNSWSFLTVTVITLFCYKDYYFWLRWVGSSVSRQIELCC